MGRAGAGRPEERPGRHTGLCDRVGQRGKRIVASLPMQIARTVPTGQIDEDGIDLAQATCDPQYPGHCGVGMEPGVLVGRGSMQSRGRSCSGPACRGRGCPDLARGIRCLHVNRPCISTRPDRPDPAVLIGPGVSGIAKKARDAGTCRRGRRASRFEGRMYPSQTCCRKQQLAGKGAI